MSIRTTPFDKIRPPRLNTQQHTFDVELEADGKLYIGHVAVIATYSGPEPTYPSGSVEINMAEIRALPRDFEEHIADTADEEDDLIQVDVTLSLLGYTYGHTIDFTGPRFRQQVRPKDLSLLDNELLMDAIANELLTGERE